MTPFKIPHHWTPEQAYVVYEFIDRLREQILVHYEHEMVEFFKHEYEIEFVTESKADKDVENDKEDLPF